MADDLADVIIEGVIEILQKPDSWLQGELSDSYGRYCVIGAFSQVASKINFYALNHWDCWLDALRRIKSLPELQAFGGVVSSDSIAKFNDDPNTTHEDVLLVLKKALYG